VPNVGFTDLVIRSLSEGLYFDENTPGFGIRVGKSRKTWLVTKGARDSRTKVRIGHYPGLSLSEARRKALVALGSPLQSIKAPTFPQARDEFLDVHGAHLKPRSLYQLRGTLRRHFKWTKTLDKISHSDISGIIEDIKAPSEAAHAFKDIRTFFNWCVPRYLPHSPCGGLKSPSKYKPRERVLTDEELKKVWNTATEYPLGSIVRLLILTGQRKSEIGSLRFEQINGQEQTITLPETKNGRSHTFPIGPLAQALIKEVPRDGNFLFMGRVKGQPYNGWGKDKTEFEKLCGIKGWTLHDLCRTFATNLAALGTPIHVTEKLLNHVSGTMSGIVSVYQRHNYEKECREVVTQWEHRLSGIIKGTNNDEQGREALAI
jgi:integrase